MQNNTYSIISTAGYSTFIHYKPDRILVDCGEGCATYMGNRVFAIEKIFLTHGHLDHISGIPSLLKARNSGKGDNSKKLEIYYPADSWGCLDLKDYCDVIGKRLKFSCTWIPITDYGLVTSLHGKRTMHCFSAVHGPAALSYVIRGVKSKLKPEFVGKTSDEIKELVSSGVAISDTVDHNIAAFSGDTGYFNPIHFQGCDILFHEATFLDEKDMNGHQHSTLETALLASKYAKETVLYHVSRRYALKDFPPTDTNIKIAHWKCD